MVCQMMKDPSSFNTSLKVGLQAKVLFNLNYYIMHNDAC